MSGFPEKLATWGIAIQASCPIHLPSFSRDGTPDLHSSIVSHSSGGVIHKDFHHLHFFNF